MFCFEKTKIEKLNKNMSYYLNCHHLIYICNLNMSDCEYSFISENLTTNTI